MRYNDSVLSYAAGTMWVNYRDHLQAAIVSVKVRIRWCIEEKWNGDEDVMWRLMMNELLTTSGVQWQIDSRRPADAHCPPRLLQLSRRVFQVMAGMHASRWKTAECGGNGKLKPTTENEGDAHAMTCKRRTDCSIRSRNQPKRTQQQESSACFNRI